MESGISQTIASYSQIFISLTTAFIAYLVCKSTKNIAQMNYVRDLASQWNHLNFVIMQDDELWMIRKHFLDGTGKIDDTVGKDFMLVGSWVNIAESYYRGMKLGYLGKETTLEYIDQILRNFRHDKEGFAKYAGRNNDEFHMFLAKRLDQL